MPGRSSLWLWAGIVLAVGIADVVVLQATGNGDSGQNDGPGQIFGFCSSLCASSSSLPS